MLDDEPSNGGMSMSLWVSASVIIVVVCSGISRVLLRGTERVI